MIAYYVKLNGNVFIVNFSWFIINDPFDYITKKMMIKTLNEDKNVIESIYYKYRDGIFITKILMSLQKYIESFLYKINI